MIYVLSLCLGLAGAWTVSRFAGKMGLLDCPNERSSHCVPTPRGGGVGIFAAFFLSAIATGMPASFWLPVSALSVLAFCGDHIDLSPRLRLYVQLALMVILVVGAGDLPSNPFLCLPWVVFWTIFIVGTANFYNFMDGINGIAGITGVVGFGLLSAYIYWNDGQSSLHIVAICISLSCLGFLPLNMPGARVFMGDIGSILLGSVFAGLVFVASQSFLDFLCLVSFLFPFYADELTTMAVRLRDGERLTHPHRRHIYQLLANEKGIPHWKVAVGSGLLQLVVGICTMLVKPFGVLSALVLLALFFIAFAWLSFIWRSSLERAFRDGAKLRA